MLVLAGGCSDHVSFPRFGGPHASESCSKNGLERGGQDRKEGLEADKDVARAGAPLASAQKEGPRSEGGSEGRCWGHRAQAGQGTWAGTQGLAHAWAGWGAAMGLLYADSVHKLAGDTPEGGSAPTAPSCADAGLVADALAQILTAPCPIRAILPHCHGW